MHPNSVRSDSSLAESVRSTPPDILEYAAIGPDAAWMPSHVDTVRIGMSLDDQISAFLAKADTKSAPSKLEPYAELIRTLRQRRWTYRQIAAALRQDFSVTVAPSTIHAFVKVRANRKGVPALPAPDTPSTNPAALRKPRFNLDA